jgi:hypothetical protein
MTWIMFFISVAVAAEGFWISVTGLDNQSIELNSSQIVSIRPPRGTDHFNNEIHCLVHTTDGKYISVIETCEVVHRLLTQPD